MGLDSMITIVYNFTWKLEWSNYMAENNRILIVEDDDQLRETLAVELADQGYDVRTASSGNEAIPITYGVELAVIILDLKMPYIDGFEVLKFVKGTFPLTKVVILTAYADLLNIEKCKKLGADEVIGKPYDLGHLFDTIHGMVKQNAVVTG
jgi:DNA-binding response OmpR family regulator